MTDDLINRARAALQGVTPGPWYMQDFTAPEINDHPTSLDITVSCTWPDHINVASMGGGYMGHQSLGQARDDARFIAAARDLVPELAAALEKAEAERDRQYDENVNRIHQQALAENALARASDPDFILAAMLDVADMDMQLADYAKAVAKAIAALRDKAKEAGDE